MLDANAPLAAIAAYVGGLANWVFRPVPLISRIMPIAVLLASAAPLAAILTSLAASLLSPVDFCKVPAMCFSSR